MWGLDPVLAGSHAPRLWHHRQESTVPCEPQVFWQEHPGGILSRGGCLGQGAGWEPGCLEVFLVSRWAQGAQEAAAVPMTKDLSMHFPLLPCPPRARVKSPMGRCSWFGDVQLVCRCWSCQRVASLRMQGSSFLLLIWGTKEGAKCGVFCPALSHRSPQVRGAQWQAALLATFFAFCLGFFELSFGIFPHLAHFT